MAQVAIISNPFQPFQNMERFRNIPAGWSIWDFLHARYGKDWDRLFDVPTLCQVNGVRTMRAEWDKPIKPNDVVTFTAIPGDPVSIVLLIVAIIVAVVAVLMMPDPANPSEGTEASDPAYTLKGQTNRLRLGEPVECHYGRCRIYPSYAAPPYNNYVGNDSIQYSLFCVGHGEFDIDTDEIYLEDSPIQSFEDVDLEIVPPGGTVTLFSSSVSTSVEVANFELYGPNQPEYTGFLGGFIVNPAGTRVSRLEVDITFPAGLFVMQEGYRGNVTVSYEFDYREVDDSGAPVGAGTWVELEHGSITRKTNTPQRITIGLDVDSGRYEVRGRRSSNKPGSTSSTSQMNWESARGYTPLTNNWPGKTIIAMRATATNNLNNSTRQRFNLWATRKLPVWDSGTSTWGTSLVATRNPAAAFKDAFTAVYGGQLTAEYLDLTRLGALYDIFEGREDWFDWTFDQRLVLWDAGKMILRVGRTTPIAQGSLVTAVRDEPVDVPSAIFNAANTVQGSVSKELRMFEFNPKDCLEVTYVDPVSWKDETVLCVLPGGTSRNPDKIKLHGCTDRQRAYSEGILMLAQRLRQRKTVTFQTGLEGYIPTYLDLVAIAHDTVRVGQGGFVVAYDAGTHLATLSEQVVFADTDIYTHVMVFRDDTGAQMGDPIEVTPGPQANQVVLASDPLEALDFSPDRVPPLYLFGTADHWSFKGRVVSINPVNDATVEVVILNYDPTVYGFEELVAPPLADANRIIDDGAPTVENVVITTKPDSNSTAIISWKPANGAQRYLIDQSVDDGLTWTRLAEVRFNITSYEFTVVPGDMKVRVSAQGAARRGTWATVAATVGVSGTPPASPLLNNTQAAFTGTSVVTTWQPSAGAVGYSVAVHKAGNPVALRTEDVLNVLTYTYTITDMLADDAVPSRDLDIKITAYLAGNTSDPATVHEASNAKPAVLASPTAVLLSGSDYTFAWTAAPGPPADFAFYRVYGSTVSGFVPSGANLLYEGAAATCVLTLAATLYWKVAAFDVWASGHTDATFTPEQTRAYP